MTRSTALGVISEEYVRTARAKGVSEFTVLFRHVLPNAALPTVTLAGLEFGVLLGGAVITETVFAYPGVGLLMIQSIYNRDFPVVRCAVLVIALLFVTLNLLTDMLYLYLNPRISFGKV
jgi:peptide/nickel transport system permease protein